MIDTIPTNMVRDLRDRALIATLTYGFARIGAALKMRVEDLQAKGLGWLIRLHEKAEAAEVVHGKNSLKTDSPCGNHRGLHCNIDSCLGLADQGHCCR